MTDKTVTTKCVATSYCYWCGADIFGRKKVSASDLKCPNCGRGQP